MSWGYAFLIALGLLFVVAIHDRLQRRHAIISNFPIIGRFRYIAESMGG